MALGPTRFRVTFRRQSENRIGGKVPAAAGTLVLENCPFLAVNRNRLLAGESENALDTIGSTEQQQVGRADGEQAIGDDAGHLVDF